jgi:hypothetical protein
MATQRQIDANRKNAKRSTGPATEAGRARSSRNALKHGLTAREFTIDERDANAFAAFRDDIVENLGPVGVLEEELAQRVALCLWRLRRVAQLEMAKAIDVYAPKFGEITRKERYLYEYMAEGLCDGLSRYEASIDRMRQRALHDFERLQARRRSEAVPVPIAVDVTHTKGVGTPVTSSGSDAGERRADEVPASIVVDVIHTMEVAASADPVTSTEAVESRAEAVQAPIAVDVTHTMDVGANAEPATSTGARHRPEPSDMEPRL